MRLVFALFFYFLSAFVAGGALAQDMPPEGSTIREKLVLGRSTFALPPGDWVVVATARGEVQNNGIKSADTVAAFLVLLDARGGFVASMFHRVPTSSSPGITNWNNALCDRRNTLHHDPFGRPFSNFPECLRLDHVIHYFGSSQAPSNLLDKKIWEWFRAKSVKIPVAVLNAGYIKFFVGDYVWALMTVNPEAFGQAKAVKRNWVESEWDPLTYDEDPNRKAFVENLKKWSYAMADNARSTLRNRKPRDAMLPSLDELRVK